MRELKFKAWLPQEQKMCPISVLTPRGAFLIGAKLETIEEAEAEAKKLNPLHLNPTYAVPATDGRFCTFFDDKIEIMQFTGLLDKHKKEIYESDVVQVYHDPSGDPEHPEWDSIPCFKFNADMTNGDCYKYVGSESTREVIGDIYTTPELIK